MLFYMKKTILVVFLILTQGIPYAQNLVFNPSFEIYSDCPHNMTQIQLATPWFQPIFDPPNGSSDYFNLCDSTLGGVWSFYQTQLPRSGNGMAGIMFYTSPSASAEIREYIEIKLDKSLTKDRKYCISYYISLIGYSTYAIDALCSCLTVDSLLCQQSNVYLLPCPNMACNTLGNIIKDTLNWVKVTMSYTAQGGEQFLTLGNFKTTPQTISEDTGHPGGWASYYFIDDVAVYECNTPEHPANIGEDKCIESGDTIILGSEQRAEYLYWWYDIQGNLLDTTATLTVSPTQTTSYILVQKDFKFDETRDTVTISVGNCPIDYSGISFEIYPNPCNGEVKVRFNSIVPAGAVMQIYDMVGRKIAQYPLTGTENIATVSLGELATGVYHATVVVPDMMRKSVKLVVIRYD
jgi:ABC-type cobalt transport system substrate-binding protein